MTKSKKVHFRRLNDLFSQRTGRINGKFTVMFRLRHFTIMTFTVTFLAIRVRIQRRIRFSLRDTITVTYFTPTALSVRQRPPQAMSASLHFENFNRRHTSLVPCSNVNNQVKAQDTSSQVLIGISRFITLTRAFRANVLTKRSTHAIRFINGRQMRGLVSRDKFAKAQGAHRTDRCSR